MLTERGDGLSEATAFGAFVLRHCSRDLGTQSKEGFELLHISTAELTPTREGGLRRPWNELP